MPPATITTVKKGWEVVTPSSLNLTGDKKKKGKDSSKIQVERKLISLLALGHSS